MGFMSFAVVNIIMLMILSFPFSNVPNELGEDNYAQINATNFIMYRNAVHDYIFANRSFKGIVNDEDLSLPSGFINQGWNARVQNKICYVYGMANTRVKNQIKIILNGSHSIGENKNNYFYPQGNSPVLVPTFIPNKSIISVLEIK